MINKKCLFLIFSIFTVVTHVHADENGDTIPKKKIIHELHVDPMPIWESKTLEKKIKESSFILLGTPVRFRFISEEAYKKHYKLIKNTPEYIKLKKKRLHLRIGRNTSMTIRVV